MVAFKGKKKKWGWEAWQGMEEDNRTYKNSRRTKNTNKDMTCTRFLSTEGVIWVIWGRERREVKHLELRLSAGQGHMKDL